MSVPHHIGIILDGNRRFAQKLKKRPWEGHRYGKDNVEKLLEWCEELGIMELTLYAFSLQNFERSEQEVEELCAVFAEACEYFLRRDDEKRKKAKIIFAGNKELFDERLQGLMRRVEEQTLQSGPFRLTICVGYGGREEVVMAVNALLKEGKEVSVRAIQENLYVPSEPDMIIRTSGEHRTSNFLVWQSTYAEWFFVDKLWPEFTKEDLVACLEEFATRQRRFGR